MDYFNIFNRLHFKDDDEKECFIINIKNKGYYLHKQIYDVYCSYNEDEISYDELSRMVRYDKYIRNVLFKFLATFEEQLRAKLFEKYELDLTNDYNTLKEKKSDKENSNFYWKTYDKDFTFKKLIELIKDKLKELNIELTYVELKEICKLRNKVMHHNLIIFLRSTTYEEVEKEIENIENVLILLYKGLHSEAQKSFMNDINKGNFKGGKYIDNEPNFKRLRLGVFKDGIFTKNYYKEK